jgi:hypothetical protein
MKNREEVLIVSVKMLKIPAISIEELTKNTIKELKKRKFSFDFLELIHRQTNKF